MILNYFQYQLHFKQPFAIAHGTRETTDAVYVELNHNGYCGYGEATFPPYLSETAASAVEFFRSINLTRFDSVFSANDYVHTVMPQNYGAKAALDMALLDIAAKQLNQPDRKSTRLNSSHVSESRMPSSA